MSNSDPVSLAVLFMAALPAVSYNTFSKSLTKHVMHAQVPEFKTKPPVDNYMFQNPARGAKMCYIQQEKPCCASSMSM